MLAFLESYGTILGDYYAILHVDYSLISSIFKCILVEYN